MSRGIVNILISHLISSLGHYLNNSKTYVVIIEHEKSKGVIPLTKLKR